jgi:hypothetical protein
MAASWTDADDLSDGGDLDIPNFVNSELDEPDASSPSEPPPKRVAAKGPEASSPSKSLSPFCLRHLVRDEEQSTATFHYYSAPGKGGQLPKFAQGIPNVSAWEGVHYSKKGRSREWVAIVRGMEVIVKHVVSALILLVVVAGGNIFC